MNALRRLQAILDRGQLPDPDLLRAVCPFTCVLSGAPDLLTAGALLAAHGMGAVAVTLGEADDDPNDWLVETIVDAVIDGATVMLVSNNRELCDATRNAVGEAFASATVGPVGHA